MSKAIAEKRYYTTEGTEGRVERRTGWQGVHRYIVQFKVMPKAVDDRAATAFGMRNGPE